MGLLPLILIRKRWDISQGASFSTGAPRTWKREQHPSQLGWDRAFFDSLRYKQGDSSHRAPVSAKVNYGGRLGKSWVWARYTSSSFVCSEHHHYTLLIGSSCCGPTTSCRAPGRGKTESGNMETLCLSNPCCSFSSWASLWGCVLRRRGETKEEGRSYRRKGRGLYGCLSSCPIHKTVQSDAVSPKHTLAGATRS